jgi:hypothetical protein
LFADKGEVERLFKYLAWDRISELYQHFPFFSFSLEFVFGFNGGPSFAEYALLAYAAPPPLLP